MQCFSVMHASSSALIWTLLAADLHAAIHERLLLLTMILILQAATWLILV